MKKSALYFALGALVPIVIALYAAPDQMRKFAGETLGIYSANIQTMKYHKPGCKFYSCRACKRFFSSSKEAEQEGFQQCKLCWK